MCIAFLPSVQGCTNRIGNLWGTMLHFSDGGKKNSLVILLPPIVTRRRVQSYISCLPYHSFKKRPIRWC